MWFQFKNCLDFKLSIKRDREKEREKKKSFQHYPRVENNFK